MGFIKNQLLKVLEWQDDSKDTIVYRFPMDGRQIMMGSKLTVRESQVAIFVNNGKLADVFQPGMYTLSTKNLPILTTLLSLPYGFKSPFFAEVYFINTKQFTNQKWGTANPVTMRDREFGTIRIRCYGKYAFRVSDPVKLLQELFGTNSSFSTADIQEYLRSILVAGVSDTIAESKISALDMGCNLLEFNKVATKQVENHFEDLGLKLSNFIVENISFPEEVEKAIDKRSSMGILSKEMDTFMKYETTQAMRDASNNPSSGNIAGVGVSLGAGLAMSGAFNESIKQNNSAAQNTKICGVCGATIPAKAKFCPECSASQSNTCPKCGMEVGAKAKFCPECGASLAKVATCPKCGEKVKANASFCPNCGEKLK